MATTICHANAERGKKCLYISFYEDKEKHYRYMRRLGLDLESLELKGLYRFVRLPITLDVDSIVNVIGEKVSEGYSIVVVDSISTLLEPLLGDPEKRAWLLNYFYQLPIMLNGLLILVAELPYGEERLTPWSVEFIVDAMILLKHRIEEGLSVRTLEIRKARGSPIQVAEAIFTITEGLGITVYAPPLLQNLAESGELTAVELPKGIMRFRRGYVVNVFYPPEPGAGVDALIETLSIALRNNMKVLIISYTHSPRILREAIVNRLAEHGLSRVHVEKLIDEYMAITALNPSAMSPVEVVARELSLVEKTKPDILVFYGVHIFKLLTTRIEREFRRLFNELMYLKSKGITVIRVGSCIDEYACNAETLIADATHRIIKHVKEDGKIEAKLYLYERFRELRVLPGNVIHEVTKRCIELIKKYIEKTNIQGNLN
jgi:circadian clock protein KaiC